MEVSERPAENRATLVREVALEERLQLLFEAFHDLGLDVAVMNWNPVRPLGPEARVGIPIAP